MESTVSRLVEIAQSIAFATTAGTTDSRFGWLVPYLGQVRAALGMEVAFVSQLVGEHRVFRVISTSRQQTADLDVGRAERLLDTYCMYVVQGRLPPVIRDVRSSSHEAALLPITERLAIGCYVSAPVMLPDGRIFGTLCCFSRGPSPDLMDSDGEALREVARAIGASLARQRATDQPLA